MLDEQLVDAVAEGELHEPALGGRAHAALERLDDGRAGAPGQVEARHRVAVRQRIAAAALGPAGARQHAEPERAQPVALLDRRELDVGPREPPRMLILGTVELALPSQSDQASSNESWIRARRCSGESTKNRPPSDQNACPPSDASGSCSSSSTRLPAAGQLGRGDQTGQTAADDDRVGVQLRAVTLAKLTNAVAAGLQPARVEDPVEALQVAVLGSVIWCTVAAPPSAVLPPLSHH